MIWHPPFLNRDRWYVMVLDRADDDDPKASWRHEWLVELQGPQSMASASWVLFGRGFGVGWQFGRNGGESDVGVNVYLGRVLSLWLRLRAPWLRWLRVREGAGADRYDYLYARHTGVRFHPWDGCILQVQVEDRDGVWRAGQPWWRDMKVTVTDIVGRTDVERTPGRTGTTVVPLPEGNYEAAWKEEVLTWRHRRLPGTLIDRVRGVRRRRDYWLDIPGGIPVEGKGENSWDCGMDGLFGCGGQTLEAAVAHAVEHVLRDRKRYGGPHNLDRPMTVAEAGAR